MPRIDGMDALLECARRRAMPCSLLHASAARRNHLPALAVRLMRQVPGGHARDRLVHQRGRGEAALPIDEVDPGGVSSLPDGLFDAATARPAIDSPLFQDSQRTASSIRSDGAAAPVERDRFALSAVAGPQRAFRDFSRSRREPVRACPRRPAAHAVPRGRHRCANVGPHVAQDVRAEFVRHGEGPSFGPRATKLDGFAPGLIFAGGVEADGCVAGRP